MYRSGPWGKTSLFLALWIGFGGTCLFAQQVLPFRHMDDRSGLNQSSVWAIFQDQQGQIWLGTQDGLHAFNGYGIKLFRHDPEDPGSISGNFITSVGEDQQGNLWVGTYASGVNRWDGARQAFVRYRDKRDGAAPITSNNITVIALLEDGTLAVGTQAGLNLLAPGSDTFKKIFDDGGDPDGMWVRDVTNFGDVLLVGTHAGLMVLDQNRLLDYFPDQPPFNASVRVLYKSTFDTLWVGTTEGLYALNERFQIKESFLHDPANPNGLPHNHVTDVLEDRRGDLWVTTFGGGAAHRQGAQGFVPVRDDSFNPLDKRLFTIFEDRGGVLWFGTSLKGVSRLDRGNTHFDLYRPGLKNNGDDSANVTRAFLETEPNVTWVGSDAGLIKIDRKRGEQINIDHPELKKQVWSLAPGPNGTIWAGTVNFLYRYDPATDQVQDFPNLDEEIPSIRTLLPARNGRDLWVASFGSGLVEIDPNGKILRRVDQYLPDRRVLVLAHGPDDMLLVGTADGMVSYDQQGDQATHFIPGVAVSKALSSPIIRAITMGEGDIIWVGTNGGLNRLIPTEFGYDVRIYTEADGLANPAVYGILADQRGMLWLSTNKGLSRFDPETDRFRNYDTSRGLQAMEFNGGAHFVNKQGELFFGGVRGFNVFRPEDLADNDVAPKLMLTQVALNSQPASLHGVLKDGLLVMEPHHQVLSLDFALADFAAPERNRFTYQLEGFDPEPRSTQPPEHTAVYTNLDPGRYTFTLSGTNPSGLAADTTLEVAVQVLPPLWRSSKAIAVYVLAFLLISGLILALILQKRKLKQRAHAVLRASEERLKAALWGSGDGLWDWQIEKGQIHRTMLWEMLSYDEDRLDKPLHHQNDLVHPDDQIIVKKKIEEHLAGNTPYYEAEYRVRAGDGSWKWILDRGRVTERDQDGKPSRVAGTHKEITAKKLSEEKLRLAAQVMDSTNDGVFITDLYFKVLQVNRRFTELTGMEEAEVLGRSHREIFSRQYNLAFFNRFEDKLTHLGKWEKDVWLKSTNGKAFLARFYMSQVQDREEQPANYVAVFADITQRKQNEEDLRFLANYDALTGLPNRTLLNERLDRAIIRAHRNKRGLAVLFTDLDRFKQINDTMGHKAGDVLLREVAARMTAAVRKEDTVARLSGDEFLVILEEVKTRDDVAVAARKIIELFAKPFPLEDGEVMMGQSIGIAFYPDDGQDVTTLLKNADTAMYAAKERGRNNYQFYDAAMSAGSQRRMDLENAMRHALANREFHLVYQPKQNVKTGEIVGCEVLLRWQSPTLGAISPAEFIPIAEESGMIVSIGAWIIEEACNHYVYMRGEGLPAMNLAINFSARQFHISQFIPSLKGILDETGMTPENLQLELTENLLIENAAGALDLFKRVKELGVQLALDDFGTGYSSLSYLRRFPIDTLKIDKSFIRDAAEDESSRAIVEAIIAMAHSLNLTVVAEGVETREQLRFLLGMNCDHYQGFLLSKPLDRNAFLAFVKDSNGVLPV